LKGIKAFSKTAFAAQLRIPGMVMLRATYEGKTVGAHLWYPHGDVVHSHLAAVNPLGYELMASYALHWFALQSFTGEVRWLNIGSGSGLAAQDGGGLAQFKRGWATGTRTAYFCGRIFNHSKYQEILATRRIRANDYFPAYRHGEFG
jgi:lipid II:glycine glycyltransferase (peptidoglycan interpeptide bridge formation enzyme)